MGISSNSVQIHPTAIVDPHAQLGPGTEVGPFSTIGEHVVMGTNCKIHQNVVLWGHTSLEDEVTVFPFAVIGSPPQHVKYDGEPTRVEIGARVTLREGVTVHRGTAFDRGVTRVGNDTFLMAYCHIAHDCVVGKEGTIANAVQLAGHVTIGDFVTIGGHSAIAQHCRIGCYSYVGGGSILRQDLLPFMVGKGTDFQVQGVNAVGLKRRGFSSDTVSSLKTLYKIFYLQKLTVNQAIEKMRETVGQTDECQLVVDFASSSRMGFIR